MQAAGNSSDPALSGRYIVKHKGFNGLIVGNHNDTATGMSEHSIYGNPNSPHGDRELPDICANGTDVYVLGDTESGTSFAAPAVAGTVALLQSVDRRLVPRPKRRAAPFSTRPRTTSTAAPGSRTSPPSPM